MNNTPTVSREMAKLLHPAYQGIIQGQPNPLLLATVPSYLDWIDPPIAAGPTSFIKNPDGRIRVTLWIQGEDAAIVEELLTSMNVEAVQLSVVEPR